MYGQGTDTGDPNNPNAFYDIVIPGPSIKSSPGGLNTDWYQPVHEVGNILSYPARDQVCSPSDIGPITIPDTDIANQIVPLISCSIRYYNGNSGTISLSFDHKTGNGNSTDYTHKLHGDLDFKATYTNTINLFGDGIKVQASSDTDIHGGSDWGHLNTSDNSTTDSTGITINEPQGDSQHSYPFYPILYDTNSGALKVGYAVGALDLQSTGTTFWTDYYGGAPDPALNLPRRFDALYGPAGNLNGWGPNTTILRKYMKGLVVRSSTVNPEFGGHDLLESNPQDGDTVLLDARAYNYSISSTPAIFTVQFSVIPYDGKNEICPGMPGNLTIVGHVCPAKYRTVIGYGKTQPAGGAQNFSLGPRANAEAYLMWNTKGFGPQGANAGLNEYRLYVDLLIPNNETVLNQPEASCTDLPCEVNFNSPNEKIVDGGQNKEGWGLIAVAAAKPNLLGASETDAIATPTGGSLGADSPAPGASQALASVSAAQRRFPRRWHTSINRCTCRSRLSAMQYQRFMRR